MHILTAPSLAIYVLCTLERTNTTKISAIIHTDGKYKAQALSKCTCVYKNSKRNNRNKEEGIHLQMDCKVYQENHGLEEEEGEGFEKIRNCMTNDICKSGGKAIF